MKVEIKVPAMGESITEATIGNIIKASGSKVAMDDEILELETDKVNQVLSAPQAGVLTLNVKPEEVVEIGQVIGFVDSEGQAAEAPKKEAKSELKKEEPKKEEVKPEKEIKPEPKQEEAQSVTGSARLMKEDFAASLKAQASPEVQPQAPKPQPIERKAERSATSGKPETRKKMSKIRKIIAQRLVEVQQSTAMLTTFNEVDMSEVMQIRDKHKDQFMKENGVKLGFMSFFVKAVVSALHAFPNVNSYIDGDEVVNREYVDIGIAVGTDKGLFVPVVRDCNHLTFSGIEKAIETYAKKAREGGLSADDLQGGGFTITNGGTYGSLMSTPIINPPQAAILGMHKILKRPVAIDDEVVIRPMMYLALSYDHRLIDGKEAVSFLVHIKDFLEDPARLLLEQ